MEFNELKKRAEGLKFNKEIYPLQKDVATYRGKTGDADGARKLCDIIARRSISLVDSKPLNPRHN